MPVNVNTVIFAIKAGVRLYHAGEQVLVQNTAERALPLPLPIGELSDTGKAKYWLLDNPEARELSRRSEFSRLGTLLNTDEADWSDGDTEYLTAVYNSWRAEKARQAGHVPANEISMVEAAAYIEIRQWSESEDSGHTSSLQRIAGTLVNIAVDYFVQTPGHLNLDKPEGRALKGFLEAIDDTDFAGGAMETIAGDLLIAVLDAVKMEPDLIGRGETTRKFVKGITTSLGESTNEFLDDIHLLTDDERERRKAWLNMLTHALVRGATGVVLTDPEKILGVREDESAVIREVGGTFAELLLGGDDDRRLRFEKVFSGEGLDNIVRSALKAVSENPGILDIEHKGLRRIIVDIADELETYDDLFTRDLGPELIRLVLEKTGSNLPLLAGGDGGDPGKNLLVLATSELLANVSEGSWTGGVWHPVLTRGHLLDVAEAVFDEVLDNPYWLKKIRSVGGPDDTPLGVAVEAVVNALKDSDAGDRLSSDTVVAAIKSGVAAAALNIDLLKKVPDTASGEARIALTAAIDAVFDGILAEGATPATRWRRAGNAALQVAIELVLENFAKVAMKKGVKAAQITKIRMEVGKWIDAVIEGADPQPLILETLTEAA